METVSIDLALLAFLGGTVVPVLVAIVSARAAHPAVKAGLSFVFALAAGLIATAQEMDGVLTKEGALAVFYAVVTAQAVHHGLLKPAGLTGGNGAVQKAIPGGIG